MASVRSLATRRGRTSSSRRTKPAMSMPNLVVSGFPSGIGVISRTCRERGASIAMTMSGAMRPRQTPYLPACSGNPAVSSALLTRSLHAYNFACVARTMLLSIEQVRLDPPAFSGKAAPPCPSRSAWSNFWRSIRDRWPSLDRAHREHWQRAAAPVHVPVHRLNCLA
jgi:hypothetical protein